MIQHSGIHCTGEHASQEEKYKHLKLEHSLDHLDLRSWS